MKTEKSELLAQLAVLVAADSVQRPLTLRLCEACRTLLGGDGASITIQSATPERVTLCATDAASAALEDFQDVLGEGPCRDAFSTGQPVSTDLDGGDPDERWPQFSLAARRTLAGGVLYALPMRPGTEVFGVLSVYRSTRGPLGLPMTTAQFLSDTVGAALLHDPLATEDGEHSGAWAARAKVHQATGMVVAQLGIGLPDALALLRAHAFAHSITLDALARRVVDDRYDFRGE